MSRAIAVAAAVFALAALVLHRAVFNGPFVEPVLLLTMGSFFLVAARICGRTDKQQRERQQKAPALLPERTRASA